MDDLEIIRKSLASTRNAVPLNVQIQLREKSTARGPKTQKETGWKPGFSAKELDEIEQKLETFNKGQALLVEEIEQNAKEGNFQAHPDIDPIPIDSLENDDSYEEAVEELIKSKFDYTVQLDEILEYDEAVLLNLYQVAVRFYENAELEKGILAFTFLTYVHPGISSFWKGLGLSYERNLNMADALKAFKMAVERSEDFSSYYDMIRCCEKNKDFGEVIDLLEKLKRNRLFVEEVENAFAYINRQKS